MGRPKYILLVRHGESEGNCDKSVNRVTPNHKVVLTQNGHYQATSAGIVLKDFLQQDMFQDPDEQGRNCKSILFYTSPYLRARQTCNDIIEGIKDLPGVDYQIREEPRMREQDFGNFQSTPEQMEKIWEERAHYGHFFYRIPHGESAADVYDRIASFNESLFRQFQLDDFPNILILVTHGIWARVFLMKWFRWSYEEFESLRNIPHCQYLIMKQSLNKKYYLKTPLKTWDDLNDDDIENNKDIEKEITDEVQFNSQYKLGQARVDDLDIESILSAQKDAIKSLKTRDKDIKDAYAKICSGKKNLFSNKFMSRFKYDNQSVVNSEESLSE